MSKTLQDYKQEIAPKTEVQIIQEFNNKKYRAIDALYIGIACVVLLTFLKLGNINIIGIQLDSFESYIELRKKLIWVSLVERAFWIYVITLFANRLNRQPLPWQIFALVTPYLALIVIGLTPKKDNNFFEFQSASNKETFFASLILTDKLKLYNHILTRANVSPHWLDKISQFNLSLFANEQTSLETLQQYEKIYKKNLLTELKSSMPKSLQDRQKFFRPLEDVGLVDKSFYHTDENSSR